MPFYGIEGLQNPLFNKGVSKMQFCCRGGLENAIFSIEGFENWQNFIPSPPLHF